MVSFIAWIALIWVVFLILGAFFGSLGDLIWIAILASVAVAIWKFIQRNNNKRPFDD